jgi:predicted metal-dependent enzyme (double-stranded beta helix superfamily)
MKLCPSLELEDFEAISLQTLSNLRQDKNELRRLILSVREEERLFSLCEHYDILDKIVLHSDEEKSLRLRLHIFADGYFDRPHNHRWSYSSCILSGSYRHIIFSVDTKGNDPDTQHLTPVLIRHEKRGDFYTLHHSQYHSVTAEPNTVTLVLRGPAQADRFRVMDRETKESWWQYGSLSETQEEKNKKRMTHERFDFIVEKLIRIGVI